MKIVCIKHLENLLPSLITAGQRWQPYCCWLLEAAMPCWFSWKMVSRETHSLPISSCPKQVSENKLKPGGVQGSRQLCRWSHSQVPCSYARPGSNSKYSLVQNRTTMIIWSELLVLFSSSTNLCIMDPCMRSHISFGFPSVLAKLEGWTIL